MIVYIVLQLVELHQFVILWILHLLKPPLPSRCPLSNATFRDSNKCKMNLCSRFLRLDSLFCDE